MRRRIPVLLFVALVVLTTVPASAAEPDPSARPAPVRGVPPTPDPTPAPTTQPDPTAAPSDDPGSPAAPDASPDPNATTPDASPATDPATAVEPSGNGGLDVTGEYIVVLKSGSDTAAVADKHEIRDGIRVGRRFTKVARAFTAHLDKTQRAALARDPSVQMIVPDEIVHVASQTVPTGVSRIGTRVSTIASIDGADQRVDADVAIVDTGIGPHPDLNIAGGYNCSTSNRNAWADANGHGTHVAGTVGALDNDIGVVGVAPGVRLWAVRILNADGYGKLSWYVCGLDWILAQRDPHDSSRPLFEAVNMSVAKDGADDGNCGKTNKDILHQAICRLYAGGITVVAAAANDHGSATHRVPAAYNEVITVSALADTDGKPGGTGGNRCYSWGGYDKDDTFADFSNYGYDVDLIAPGKCIWSTKPGPTYGYSSGTSMAAPAVTGAVALYKASRPNATPAQVKEGLQYLGNLDWKTSTDPDSHHEKLLDVSKLGTLGTFSVDAGTAPLLGEIGGSTAVPVTLTRSATFFERVAFKVTSLPSGWSASWKSSSLMGWTANANTLTVTAPDPVAAGSYSIGISTTNQGRTKTTTATVVVENDKPTVHAPVGRVVNTQLGSTTAPVRFSWAAATDPSTSVAGYETQLRVVGGDWGAVVALSPGSRSITRGLTIGTAYEARLRARDRVGNWSDWVTSAPVTVLAADDRSGAIHYVSSWGKTTSASAWRTTLRTTTHKGATASYAFTGRGISVLAPTGRGRAKVSIYLDGALKQTISLSASSTHHRQIIYSTAFSDSGPHRITVRVASSGMAQLDAFLVQR